MDEDGQAAGSSSGGLVDATQFLRFSEALREGFARLAAADLSPASRKRWQHRLLRITNVAKHDLDRAEADYAAFRADFAREHGGGSGAPDR